jgi:uncharacterized membrane protein
MNTKSLLTASLIGLGTIATTSAFAEPPKEKCAGVAKAGMNDCGALDGSHGCAGQSKVDSAATEWVYLPSGVCKKLAGGTVVAPKAQKM